MLWSVYIEEIIKISGAIAAFGAVLIGFINTRKIQQVHISINSRMDQLLKQTDIASQAIGFEQGRLESKVVPPNVNKTS